MGGVALGKRTTNRQSPYEKLFGIGRLSPPRPIEGGDHPQSL